MIPTSTPNAAETRWRELVRAQGSCVSGANGEIHHPVGRKGRHNKIAIGHWWILCLTPDEHTMLHQDFGSFVQDVYFWNGETRKEVEKKLFAEMVDEIGQGEMPDEVYTAIREWRR